MHYAAALTGAEPLIALKVKLSSCHRLSITRYYLDYINIMFRIDRGDPLIVTPDRLHDITDRAIYARSDKVLTRNAGYRCGDTERKVQRDTLHFKRQAVRVT